MPTPVSQWLLTLPRSLNLLLAIFPGILAATSADAVENTPQETSPDCSLVPYEEVKSACMSAARSAYWRISHELITAGAPYPEGEFCKVQCTFMVHLTPRDVKLKELGTSQVEATIRHIAYPYYNEQENLGPQQACDGRPTTAHSVDIATGNKLFEFPLIIGTRIPMTAFYSSRSERPWQFNWLAEKPLTVNVEASEVKVSNAFFRLKGKRQDTESGPMGLGRYCIQDKQKAEAYKQAHFPDRDDVFEYSFSTEPAATSGTTVKLAASNTPLPCFGEVLDKFKAKKVEELTPPEGSSSRVSITQGSGQRGRNTLQVPGANQQLYFDIFHRIAAKLTVQLIDGSSVAFTYRNWWQKDQAPEKRSMVAPSRWQDIGPLAQWQSNCRAPRSYRSFYQTIG